MTLVVSFIHSFIQNDPLICQALGGQVADITDLSTHMRTYEQGFSASAPWRLGLDGSLGGAVLCTAGLLAASLASAHSTHLSAVTQRCPSSLLMPPEGSENHCCGVPNHLFILRVEVDSRARQNLPFPGHTSGSGFLLLRVILRMWGAGPPDTTEGLSLRPWRRRNCSGPNSRPHRLSSPPSGLGHLDPAPQSREAGAGVTEAGAFSGWGSYQRPHRRKGDAATELSVYHAPVLPRLRRPSEVSLRSSGAGMRPTVSERLPGPRVVRWCARTLQKSHD